MSDIRLICGMHDHPKVIKLIRKHGFESFYCLTKLWCWSAENRPKGELSGMDLDDIEIAAGWTGDRGVFFNAVLGVWLDDDMVLHDWKDHQGYVYHAPERSAKAKKAAAARWSNQCNEHATSIEKLCNEHEFSNAPTPTPTPKPTPKPDTKDLDDAFQAYQDLADKTSLPKVRDFSKTRRTHLQARLDEHGLDVWQEAMNIVEGSEYLLGKIKDWNATFDWLVKPSNFAKVIEGNYGTSKHKPINQEL